MTVSSIEADPPVRVRLDVSYDGTEFAGWARQPDRRTVQAVVEDALATVLRRPGVHVQVAGRTDTGVHASGQVAHVDVPAATWHRDAAMLVRRLAGVLPPDVRVHAAVAVPADFDARFAALWRRYVYRGSDRPGGVDPLLRRSVTWWPRSLDVDAMGRAGAALVGLHDFAAFCRRREGATTIRTLHSLEVARRAELIEITVVADAFCHSMVRSLVGALVAVGERRRDESWPAGLLDRDRRADDVPVAPARGLTLVQVAYPPDAELAARVSRTMARRDS